MVEDDRNDEKLYCTCKRPSFGEMVACDDETCETEWFHVSCMGLKENQVRGEWFCPACLERRKRQALSGAGTADEPASVAASRRPRRR